MIHEKAYVRIADGQMHYAISRGSDDAVPLLLIHKTVSTFRMWLPVMAALGLDRTMIAFDTPGFGESFDPPGEVPLSRYADWIGEGMDALGIKAAHVVGHHTGAGIGLELASRRPDLVRSLGLIGPLPLTPEERIERSTRFGAPFTPEPTGAYLMDTWAYVQFAGAEGMDLANREMAAMLRSWQTRSWTYGAVWKQDFLGLFQKVRVPLALQCAPDDVLWDVFDRACELRPDALAVRLPEGGRNYQTDLVPDAVAAGIRAQIERAEAD